MKKIVILAVSFIMIGSINLFAQNKIIEHKVGKGDTVSSIARKYNVSPSDIYRLNPNATEGVKLDAVIKVPLLGKTEAKTVKKHVVEAGENFYSISRRYNISPTDLKAANKTAEKEGLKTGTVLAIPVKSNFDADTTSKNVKVVTIPQVNSNPIKNIYHTVSPKETKFGIAKQYGLTIEELEALNPEIKGDDTIEVGIVLRLTSNVPPYGSITSNTSFVDYVIQPQETLFSLAKKAGISEEEFIKLNPSLLDGVLAGSIIKMPRQSSAVNKPITDLTQSISKNHTKNLVLLLPFNADKVGTNKDVTIQDQLKNDKFLNMTLDFYAGALVAIDSAKKMGLPIKVQVLDSKENKTSSAIVSLYNNGSFTKADAIIGPFFQNHVEALAAKLEYQQTPIVSPLSNEKGKPLPNLYQSMPSSTDVKKRMIDFLHANNGNIIAIVDPKKGSARKYITETFPGVKLAAVDESGAIDSNTFKQLLSKTRTNYVILETESLNLILNTCKLLVTNATDYSLQMVTLEKNDKLDSDEVSLNDLMKLKLLYPSVTRDVTQTTPTSFAKTFKAYNNTMPNKFATRGFDVTFDTILRLFNQGGFKSTVENSASEQLENKFNYINIDGAYYNKGVYLLYYDSDLTIKEAN